MGCEFVALDSGAIGASETASGGTAASFISSIQGWRAAQTVSSSSDSSGVGALALCALVQTAGTKLDLQALRLNSSASKVAIRLVVESWNDCLICGAVGELQALSTIV